MRKKIWTIVLTVLIFLSGVLLGVSATFRVSAVTVDASVVSDEAHAEAKALELRLAKAYDKDSTLFVDSKKAEKILEEFPYFYMTSFKRSYPRRIVIKVTEDAEVYAVSCLDASEDYYVLNAQGEVLGIRNTPENRFDGEANVFLKGLTVELSSDNRTLQGDDLFAPMLAMNTEISRLLGGVRSNVVSAEVYIRNPETIFCFTMREGVKIYVGSPETTTAEKANAAIEKYLSLSDYEKLTGAIVVLDGVDGLVVTYQSKDPF